MLHKKHRKDKYPILVALAFIIFISAFAFMLIFAANAGPVIKHNNSSVESLPNVTRLTPADFTNVDIDNSKIHTGPLVLVNNNYAKIAILCYNIHSHSKKNGATETK